MISLLSRMMDAAADAHFRTDLSGRSVFFPFTAKGKAYFVDSKADEQKIRACLKMFRSSMVLISFLVYPSIFIPGLILEDYGGLSPKRHRLEIALGIPLFFWLVLTVFGWMLWCVYKDAVPGLTASLTEVGLDIKTQLREATPPRTLALVCVFAGIVLLGTGILLACYYSHWGVGAPR